ncbi:3-deoxy-D-manno-octulosonic acid transferase [Pedobacter sp. MC2016-15]|uniref:3-deoxy-D-manno-octulosonic acid transferase n=1 Tax=Pedobacter sp. MC2016-15 TaxID=2994473 RepID=UPI002245D3A5|nr:glycosyltransferase N-terminal domain-containing protein [Pedobacter sp. MC2016-15]MCX2480868.1 3-deoxy-D-manno-octulosonic acid transferase [Pedobacter sp. MC2016-15]
MLWLYNFAIFLYKIVLHIAAIINTKAKLFLNGRRNIFNVIRNKIDVTKKHIWFHFASLGEFEQGRPVLEELRNKYPAKPIVITFFSPSGYEIRKNTPLAEGVFYLPLDTKENAAEFIHLVNPEIAIFTKYEFWYHYFQELHQQQVPLFIISGIFRPEQVFFKWYGNLYREMLNCVHYFFVQNEQSVQLLKGLNLNNVALSGDTRFDRVFENAKTPKELPLIRQFCGEAPVFIAGSTWLPDEQLLKELILQFPGWKFIIAPHEIHDSHLQEILKLVPDTKRYTQLIEGASPADQQVLLIDNIGILSSVYQYGKIAYIGGGFGTGIHNTLEAAAFELPVIFGPKYDKFQEAKDLLALQAAISIGSAEELSAAFIKLQKDEQAGPAAKKYVEDKTGSTAQIVKHLEPYI